MDRWRISCCNQRLALLPMTANDIIGDARVARVRELKTALAAAKARLAQTEAERDALMAHFPLALAALKDFETMPTDGRLRIIDGWNVILRTRSVSKLTSEDISQLKAEYLASLGIMPPDGAQPAQGAARQSPVATWIVFDGATENSYRSGAYRVTYTGGTGAHRADRMILDYIHAAKLLGLDVSRITVETADKALAKRLSELGANANSPATFHAEQHAGKCGNGGNAQGTREAISLPSSNFCDSKSNKIKGLSDVENI